MKTKHNLNSNVPLEVGLGEPSVVAVSEPRWKSAPKVRQSPSTSYFQRGEPGEQRWGYLQFPRISRMDDGRLTVAYSIHADSRVSYGKTRPCCISSDNGKTWEPGDADELADSAGDAIVFPDGEAIKFPRQTPLDASTLSLPPHPIRGVSSYGHKYDYYHLVDLPEELQAIPLRRRKAHGKTWKRETAKLAIPDLAVQVSRWDWTWDGWFDPNILVQPDIRTSYHWTITPDLSILLFIQFKLFDKNGNLAERYRVVTLRSDDRGRTWQIQGIPGYFPNEEAERNAAMPYLDDPGSNYNLLWGGKDEAPIPNFVTSGLYEPGVVSFGDGRMLCVMRSDTGGTHQPMFLSRSEDWGRTWTEPEILTPFGVRPRLVLLDNNVIILVYGRPGVQLLFCTDGMGKKWQQPITLLPEKGEKSRKTLGRRGMPTTPNKVGHDDTCGNCSVLKTGPDRFLIAYSDFRHVNQDGKQCKAIKAREVTVKT